MLYYLVGPLPSARSSFLLQSFVQQYRIKPSLIKLGWIWERWKHFPLMYSRHEEKRPTRAYSVFAWMTAILSLRANIDPRHLPLLHRQPQHSFCGSCFEITLQDTDHKQAWELNALLVKNYVNYDKCNEFNIHINPVLLCSLSHFHFD